MDPQAITVDQFIATMAFIQEKDKFVQVNDRPTEKEQIQMIVRRLQPKIARHVIGESRGQMSVLFLLPDRGPSDITSQPHVLPGDILLAPNISYATQFIRRPSTSIPRARLSQSCTSFALMISRCFSQLGMSLSQALRKIMDRQGHDIDQCTALRHAIQNVIDQVSIPSTDHVDDGDVQMMRSGDIESEPIILDERSHGGY
ncbi:hypothetical protein CK203_026466 [Vitis vinifera]|uniref:Uncharacterized protein n=1 Tax=Vitis vinifera TaxID=29760 RepID=A0A438IVN4_VITVI|nr:hypothetical protein CK203_026466 [Vitis vinifera]